MTSVTAWASPNLHRLLELSGVLGLFRTPDGGVDKLDMPPSGDDNRRVLAVLAYLNA